MNFSAIFKKGEEVVAQNATAILTGVGVVGTVVTAVLTGKAAYKTAYVLEQFAEEQRELMDEPIIIRDFRFTDKAKMVWHLYIPAAGTGITTITAIVFANRISSKRAAALAAAYMISDSQFSEYKEKTLQHLGVKKETALTNELAQDRVNMHPIGGQTIIIGDGDVVCYDAITGRYFMCNMEKIRKAENTVNKEIIDQHAASLSSFYEEIGLPCTSYSDDVGWNIDNLIAIDYSTVMTDDNRPCIVIDFKIAPITGYGRTY